MPYPENEEIWLLRAPCIIKKLALILISISILGCPVRDEPINGIKDPRADYMKELASRLDANNIKYTIGKDGMLKYYDRDIVKVQQIRGEVDNALNKGEVIRWSRPEELDLFIRVLDALNREYRMEHRDNGQWIRWYPENNAEARELPERVLRYYVTFGHRTDNPCDPVKQILNVKSTSPAESENNAAVTVVDYGSC